MIFKTWFGDFKSLFQLESSLGITIKLYLHNPRSKREIKVKSTCL